MGSAERTMERWRLVFCNDCGELLGVEDHIRIRDEHLGRAGHRGYRYEVVVPASSVLSPPDGDLVERVAAAMDPELMAVDSDGEHDPTYAQAVRIGQEMRREDARAAIAAMPPVLSPEEARALKRKGHAMGCPVVEWPTLTADCDCGYTAAKAKLRALSSSGGSQ